MALALERGRKPGAVKAVAYGPEGVGKTTFAAKWPGAVFIDVEDGSRNYDVARMLPPRNWSMLLAEVAEVADAADEVGTLVIDTADAAEMLCKAHIMERDNKDSLESWGYGKGYTVLAEEFKKLLDALDGCVKAGVNVLVLAHCLIKKFEQPDEQGAYDRYELKLEKKCAPLLKEWCDLLLFANFKTDVMKDKDGKAHASGGTRRVMHAQRRAAYDAKNRFGLEATMPFEFEEIEKIFDTDTETEPEPKPKQKTETKPKSKPKRKAEPEPKPKPKPKPEQEPKAEPEPETEPEEEPKAETEAETKPEAMGVLPQGTKVTEVTPDNVRELHRLMERDGVNEVMLAMATGRNPKNSYTERDRIADYSEKYIDSMVAHWDKVREKALEYAPYATEDIPF